MTTNISKIFKIEGRDEEIQLRFEPCRVVLEDKNGSTAIHNSRIPDVIALLEAARDEVLDVRAAKGTRASVRSAYVGTPVVRVVAVLA